MSARAIWKGVLTLGSLEVPVKLYSAVEDHSVHFRLLHAEDESPVHQEMVHPETLEPVPREEIQRAAELDDGSFVKLTPEELASLTPPASRTIELTRFVPAGGIRTQWYERPYWVGPDADAEDEYFALAEALAQENRAGIARWVMRNKRYFGALRASGDHLVLVTLRPAEEVVTLVQTVTPRRAPDRQEIALAEQLMDTLSGPFEPAAYHDEYRERVLELIETKARGGTVRLRERERPAEMASLADMLRQSLKPAREAGGG